MFGLVFMFLFTKFDCPIDDDKTLFDEDDDDDDDDGDGAGDVATGLFT